MRIPGRSSRETEVTLIRWCTVHNRQNHWDEGNYCSPPVSYDSDPECVTVAALVTPVTITPLNSKR